MTATKQKAVISAEKSQLERVRRLVDGGRYRTVSDFVREALEEKLERLDQMQVAEAVERYCAAGHAGEDLDLIPKQAMGADADSPPRRNAGRKRRASR
jgi:Arc/MetJ-type ribon-helix-helix transcriptional regulator